MRVLPNNNSGHDKLMKQITMIFLFSFVAVLLTGCADETAVSLGPQEWQNLQFVVETRPTPVRAGMNEFIVIASREVYKPGVGLIVSLRVDEEREWRQAIQDGFTGVYRRAVLVNDPQNDVLAVHVQRTGKAKDANNKKEETILYFPLNQKR